MARVAWHCSPGGTYRAPYGDPIRRGACGSSWPLADVPREPPIGRFRGQSGPETRSLPGQRPVRSRLRAWRAVRVLSGPPLTPALRDISRISRIPLLAPNWRIVSELRVSAIRPSELEALLVALSLFEKIRFPETETLVRRDAVRCQHSPARRGKRRRSGGDEANRQSIWPYIVSAF